MATKKTRLYEPWGYQEENDYEGAAVIFENLLEKFFTSVTYDKETNKISFGNKEDEEVATLDVSEFAGSGSIEKGWYYDGYIYLKYTNGNIISIDVRELAHEYEFSGGLQENNKVVTVKIDGDSQPYIDATNNGIKIKGIDEAIESAVEEETTRATNAEESLSQNIAAEVERAISAETELNSKIEELPSAEILEKVINQLGYSDNDTLVTTNEHEAAFGEYNVSNTGEDPSEQTIFSIGNGTSDEERSNALEVRKNGDLYLMIEGEFMKVNDLLGMLAHEVY